MCTIAKTGKVVALKKFKQDKKYKSRELQIHKELHHMNIIKIHHAFFSNDSPDRNPEEAMLNIIMDFIPTNVFRIQRGFKNFEQNVHPLLTKIYIYQLFRALNYIGLKGIIHRDIKPLNLLVDPTCHILKVCDFGSAKKINTEEKSTSYICTRYYRAPELMFGSRNYTNAIDMWSAGCVFAELMYGEPVFKGEMAHSQLIEIIKKIGSPSEAQILAMNPDYKRKGFPMIEP